MAIDLGIRTVAEGVETKEHVELLQKLNCDVIQGYYFGKPIPANEFTKSLPQKDAPTDLAMQGEDTKRFNLHKNNELLTDMVNFMPLAFALWNKEGKLVKFNEELVTLFGFTSDAEYIKRRKETKEKYQPDGKLSAEVFSSFFKYAYESGKKQAFMFWMRHSDGTPIPCEISLVRIINKGEHMISCYLRDMRLQVESENIIKQEHLKLQALTDEYQLLLDHNPLCINIWGRDNSLIMCNKAVCSMFDIESEQIYMDHFHDFSPEYQPDGTKSSENIVINAELTYKKGTHTFPWLHQKLNGEPIPTEITLVCITLKGETVLAAFIRDMRVISL